MNSFVAYELQGPLLEIRPAAGRRAWMDGTPNGFANRCLPLLVANQSGWEILTPVRVTAAWNGGVLSGDCEIECEGGAEPPVAHFGSGIITWRIPYLFRTPPGWNLLMRGPANLPKDGASALEGVVESDWAPQPAFHSWKLTRVGYPVTWEVEEPICLILPQRRGELEDWRPRRESLFAHEEISREYIAFSESRTAFNATRPRAWQKDYFLGTSPGKAAAPLGAHQTKLRLRPFASPDGSVDDGSSNDVKQGERRS